VFPLQNTYIWKAKIVKHPKFDPTKLMDVHGSYEEDAGEAVERPDEEAPLEAEAVKEEWGDT